MYKNRAVLHSFFRFDRYQTECVIPWVNDVLLLLTVALQAGQQLRDKLDILAQYKQEINIDTRVVEPTPA